MISEMNTSNQNSSASSASSPSSASSAASVSPESLFDQVFAKKETLGDKAIYEFFKQHNGVNDFTSKDSLLAGLKGYLRKCLLESETGSSVNFKFESKDKAKPYWTNLREISYAGKKTSFVICVRCQTLFKYHRSNGK